MSREPLHSRSPANCSLWSPDAFSCGRTTDTHIKRRTHWDTDTRQTNSHLANPALLHFTFTMKITYLSLIFLSVIGNAVGRHGEESEFTAAAISSVNTSTSFETGTEIGVGPDDQASPSFSPNIPVPLRQFIMKMASSPGSSQWPEDILPRQQGGVGGGAAAPAATPTQISPVTVYFDFVHSVQVTYTQTFAPTPDPWVGPQSGNIGLGTLTGKVGAVKTAQADAGTLKARGGMAIAGAGLGGYLLL